MGIFRNVSDAVERRRRRNNLNAAILVGVGCLGLLAITAVMAVVSGLMNLAETSNVRSLYGDVYASACNPVPMGQTAAVNAPDAVAPRQLLLLESDSERRHAWHAQLPEQWRADTAEAVVLIGCVEAQDVLLETCEYARDMDNAEGGFIVRVRRQQQQATVVLLDAATSRRIDSLTLSGPEPAPCPPDDEDELTTSRNEVVEDVTLADFSAWFEAYVFSG